ncbi:hypothetical protein KL918_003689 [Ogataea parapolymorpha]|uniref:PWWP domain-containing protein n=1 Tax=Ogataea parapolymorpha (strain ATCC 26012 / BCRC 20466 / JCM 22074 / NRRL Y-7560 / DL-1) TaxID=871575 RepID=W1QIG1_OGAPD|nr:hypothetical protein HPODL_04905 [Ogataea parapolymorpha DL-1]ESX02145.1 hypothetical protein HPODL_04905 [Ogataea parapolymorpha DL-1]KAG7866224.1 hypothetical protein KL918_003689 [Ogataea parapolymorpha]KAG7871357.1 hypothetical protein KL916_004152 [Ogataea parapolymorpha]
MFPPGSLVLTKIKGFPEWPSRVIDYEQLPEKIRNMKPGSAPGRKRRRAASEPQLVCVKFYGDDEYFWCTEKDLKPLTDDMVTEYLVKKGELPDSDGNFRAKRASKVSSLTNAYLCANNKDVSPQDFALYGSYGRVGEEDEDYVEEADEEEEDEEEDEEDEEEEEEEEDSDSDEEAYGRSTKRKHNGSHGARKKAKVEIVEDLDSDWGLESDVEDAGLEIPSLNSVELVDEVKKSTKFFGDIRVQIQKLAFPTDTPVDYAKTGKELEPLVNKLSGYRPVSRAVLKSTNIAKVLVLLLKKPEFARLRVAKKIGTVLKNWLDLHVEPDPHWGDDYEPSSEPEEEQKEAPADEIKQEPTDQSVPAANGE